MNMPYRVPAALFLIIALAAFMGACSTHDDQVRVAPGAAKPLICEAPPAPAPPEPEPELEPAPGPDRLAMAKDALEQVIIYFDYDKSNIRPDAAETLDGVAELLTMFPSIQMQVYSHCDERGSNEYNAALGARRAESAKAYLVEKGINHQRLTTTNFGEELPLVSGSGEAAWAKNRAARFVVVESTP